MGYLKGLVVLLGAWSALGARGLTDRLLPSKEQLDGSAETLFDEGVSQAVGSPDDVAFTRRASWDWYKDCVW